MVFLSVNEVSGVDGFGFEELILEEGAIFLGKLRYARV